MNCNNTCGHRPHPCPHRAKTYKPCSVAITNLLLYHYAHLKWGRTTNFVAVGDYAKKVYMNKATKANIQRGRLQNETHQYQQSKLQCPQYQASMAVGEQITVHQNLTQSSRTSLQKYVLMVQWPVIDTTNVNQH